MSRSTWMESSMESSKKDADLRGAYRATASPPGTDLSPTRRGVVFFCVRGHCPPPRRFFGGHKIGQFHEETPTSASGDRRRCWWRRWDLNPRPPACKSRGTTRKCAPLLRLRCSVCIQRAPEALKAADSIADSYSDRFNSSGRPLSSARRASRCRPGASSRGLRPAARP